MAQPPASMAKALEGLTGPFIVGTAVSTFLFGVTLSQVYTYFSTFKSDRALYRWAVVGLFIVDVLHTAFSQVTLWQWFVTHYGEPQAILKAPWSFAMSPVLTGISAFVVQLFYAHRVYLLAKRTLVIPVLIGFGALFQLVWATGATGQVFIIQYFQGFQVWTYGVACWLGGAAATDLLITASLLWILVNSKRGISKTNNIIDKLISLTVETNGLTFTVAVLDLILFSAFKDASHVGPHLVLVKLYINSFLVTLNSREKLAEHFGGSRTIHTSAPTNEDASQVSRTLGNNQVSGDSPPMGKIKSIYGAPDGIHVYTTATLSANLVKNDPERSESGYGLGAMRPDHSNGFTTDIVGGADKKEPYNEMNEKNIA